MPGPVAPNQGVILTMGWQCNQDRFTCSIPYICMNTLVGTTVANDFRVWVPGVLLPAWRLCLAADCWFRGYSLDGMMKGRVVPDRRVAIPGSLPGQQVGDSDPQNTSMYGVFYSNIQAALVGSTDVGKTFVGPCPESKYTKGAIDEAFRSTALAALIDAIGQGFTSGGGKQYLRAQAARTTLVELCYESTVWFARGDVASQKRRIRPLL